MFVERREPGGTISVKEGQKMSVNVSYAKLWEKISCLGMDADALREAAKISVRSIAKLQSNQDVRMSVLLKICDSLNCDITDIAEFTRDAKVVDVKETPRNVPSEMLIEVAADAHGNEPKAKKSRRRKATDETLELDFPVEEEKPVKADFKFIDLFAGIGGIRLGFESVGGHCVFSSEWDKNAAKTYEANFGEKPQGDITKIAPSEIPDFDILLGGFPCQPFSIIGDKAGFNHETQGTLFFDIERILLAKKPKAFMLENVRNLTAHDKGRTFRVIISHLENAGYKVYHKVLNALDYGVPQKRERIIIVGFRDDIPFEYPKPLPVSKRATIKDIIDPEAEKDKKLFVRPSIRDSRLQRNKHPDFPRPYISHENVAGSITPHNFSCALRAGASANYILINDERRPSAREMLRIQGFPDSFKVVVPYGHIKHQTGNSVAVPVIKAVARQMIKTMLKEGVLK